MSLHWKTFLPRYLLLALFMLVVLIPLSGVVLSAFKTDIEVIRGPFSLPETWRLDNFIQAWQVGRFNIFFKNSAIVAVTVVIMSVFLSILTGYAFGVLPLPGK